MDPAFCLNTMEVLPAKHLLVRKETSPEDIGGMNVAKGILTSTGGMTSHAAVVARGMGKPCVAGCGELDIDAGADYFACTVRLPDESVTR